MAQVLKGVNESVLMKNDENNVWAPSESRSNQVVSERYKPIPDHPWLVRLLLEMMQCSR